MKYATGKHGTVTACIETLDKKAISNMNIILDFDKNQLRKRVGDFILLEIKKMKPDCEMVMWKTTIGGFCIFKESSLDYCFEPHKSKYNYIETKLEFTPTKGEIKTIVIKSRRFVNKEYEGFNECPNCFEKGLLDYTITRQDAEMKVCKKCKDFDKLLEKIEKKLDAEEKKKHKRKSK